METKEAREARWKVLRAKLLSFEDDFDKCVKEGEKHFREMDRIKQEAKE